jgi:hypothetical protein
MFDKFNKMAENTLDFGKFLKKKGIRRKKIKDYVLKNKT